MRQCFCVKAKKVKNFAVDEAITRLESRARLSADEWCAVLCAFDADGRELLARRAREVALHQFGSGVYVRALIEISSYCRNNCFYCGLRRGNSLAARYRLGKDDILACCERAAAAGFNTFVLQGGEDPAQSDAWLADVVSAIKERYPEKAVTLSVGERSAEGYAILRAAGADRYLLRHETADATHYSNLHPQGMSLENRKRCLYLLKELGYQVGSGMMIGSPGQTIQHLAQDLMLLDELQPQMIGIGPFIPARGTPFESEQRGSADTALLLVSLLRLRFPRALVPATTALATLLPDGTEQGVLAGANVVMPNVTPPGERGKYTIYDNKKITGSEAVEQVAALDERLAKIGYHVDFSRGDYKT